MAIMAGQIALSLDEQSFADRTVAAHSGKPGELLGILESLQDHNPHKYLSPEILEYVAEKTDIPLAQIFSVVTFYALFNLEPQGEHSIWICRGTACHTRGSRNLLQRLRLELGCRRRAKMAPTSSASPRPTGATPCAPWRASDNARLRPWWRWITRSSAT